MLGRALAEEGGSGAGAGAGSSSAAAAAAAPWGFAELEKGMFEDAALEARAAGPALASARVEALCALEAIEERMRGETCREVRVWWCVQCARDYSGGEPLPSCREGGHELRREARVMHYFRCGSCSYRLAHPAAMCAAQCPKCAARGPWSATSVHNIKDGDAKGLTGLAQQQAIMSLRFV